MVHHYYLIRANAALEDVKQFVERGDFPENRSDVRDGKMRAVLSQLLTQARSEPWTLWQLRRAVVVEIKPLSEVIHLQSDIRKALSHTYSQRCYRNAMKVSQELKACYCEGWVSGTGASLIRHAWNRLAGLYFDVTGEQFLENYRDRIYVLGFQVEPEEALDLWRTRENRPWGADLLAGAYWQKHRELRGKYDH